jgi:hypothetical protein
MRENIWMILEIARKERGLPASSPHAGHASD